MRRVTSKFLSTDGIVRVSLLTEEERYIVGTHADAVQNFLLGCPNNLLSFFGVTVAGHELETDPCRLLTRAYQTGELKEMFLVPDPDGSDDGGDADACCPCH